MLKEWFMRPAADAGVSRDASDDRFFAEGLTGVSQIGVSVTTARARQVPVVRDCLKTLSESVAGLEFGVFRRIAHDESERVDNHPITALMNSPNNRRTPFEFIGAIVDDLCAEGDFYARVELGDDAEIAALHRLEPHRTRVEELQDGSLRYVHTDRFGTPKTYLEDEIWHIPMPPLRDNITGTSPILHDGVEAVAVAIALQNYANSLFTNDATPPYALEVPAGQHFDSEKSKKNFLNAWTRWVTGKNRGKPGLLEHGITVKRLGLTSEEAQFLETRKELWLDLTRLWRVPPHLVGILDRATFSNIEQQSLDFVIYTLRPILELIEHSITKFLIEPGQNEYFQFNVESLLRGDIKSRYEAYAMGRQWGWLSVNDVLRLERRNGIGPAGDRYIEPLNMVPVGTPGARDGRQPDGVNKAIAFLRESVAGGKTGLEMVKDAA